MPNDSGPRPVWQPTAAWQFKRITATAVPLLAFGYIILHATGLADWSAWGYVLYIGTVLPIGLAIGAQSRLGRSRRTEDLRALGTQEGWSFFPTDPRFATRWSTTPFGTGRGRRASDVAIGAHRGVPCAVFTYSYTTGNGDSRSKTTLSVATVMLPARLPTLTVTPESLVGEHAPGIVREDIDVENETFNRRYRVRCQYRKYASDVLVPRTIEALLSVEPFSWRIEGQDIVAWGAPTSAKAAIEARLDVLVTIAGNIPQFVWKDVAELA